MTEKEHTIVKIQSLEGKVLVTWSDGSVSPFHFIWLRDNCRCADCGEPTIGRRTLRLTDLSLDVRPTDITVNHYANRHGSSRESPSCLKTDQPGTGQVGIDQSGISQLAIKWSDGHESIFSDHWLQTYRYDRPFRISQCFKPPLWDRPILEHPPEMLFDEVNSSDDSLLEMLCHIRDHGLCFLKGAEAKDGVLEPFVNKIGYIQETNFGRVQDLVIDRTKPSIANDVTALKTHTDEPYRASPPGILMFHCIATDVNGAGSSTFMDGFQLAEILRQEDPEGFQALAQNRQTYRRHFAGDVDLVTEFPVISIDEFGNICGIRINDRVASPLNIDETQIEIYYRGLKRFLQLTEDPDRMILRILQPGDIAIFDNHRILHGRTTISMKGKRWLQWMQIERGDFYSTLRITADRLNIPRDANPLLRGAYS
ncbi:MAG: DUF971 domain-containing protein [Gammaproteobacteria bacterium]|nr:DUF971 domain-containing protein [Gammaproteobacteria bacterium]